MAQTVKLLPTMRETGFDPWVRKIPWRRKRQPTPLLLPGKSHGWRILLGYSPWGRKESDMTERLHFFTTESRPLLSIAQKKFYIYLPCYLSQFSSVAQSCPTLCDPMNRVKAPLNPTASISLASIFFSGFPSKLRGMWSQAR